MTSKIDLSLDELVQLKKTKKPFYQLKTGQQQGMKKFGQQQGPRKFQKFGQQQGTGKFQKFGQQQGTGKFQKFGQQQGTGKFQKFGQQQGTGKFQKFGQQQGSGTGVFQRIGQQQQPQGEKSVSDLRDVLAKKQKTTVTDLRAKLKPKALTTSKGKPTPPISKGRDGGPPARTRPQPRPRARSPPFVVPASKRRSDPSPSKPIARRYRDPPINLPSYSETKKITITVPGLNRPVSEPYNPSTYRREERLAAAIARSKEARQDSYMRGREEFLASAITSAMGVTSPTMPERERGSVGGYPRLRDFSRSPSPPLVDLSYESQFTSPSIHRSSSLGGAPRTKGLTTMTTMSISNLSDTVSKNDVAELCGAVGPLEAIHMIAPGVADVIFKYKDDALEAYKKYNQRNLDGQPMICRLQAASRARMASSNYGRGLTDSYGEDFYSHSSGFY